MAENANATVKASKKPVAPKAPKAPKAASGPKEKKPK